MTYSTEKEILENTRARAQENNPDYIALLSKQRREGNLKLASYMLEILDSYMMHECQLGRDNRELVTGEELKDEKTI